MGYYKITNITPTLGKRHIKANTSQFVEISDKYKVSKIEIVPNGEIFLEVNFLPVAIQKMRTEGLITVVELDKNNFQKYAQGQEAAKKKLIAASQPQKPDTKAVESSAESKRQRIKQQKKED